MFKMISKAIASIMQALIDVTSAISSSSEGVGSLANTFNKTAQTIEQEAIAMQKRAQLGIAAELIDLDKRLREKDYSPIGEVVRVKHKSAAEQQIDDLLKETKS